MSEAVKELVSSGALGATLVVVLILMSWLVKLLASNHIKQTDAIIKALGELVEASRAIRDNCRDCRTDSMRTLSDAQKGIEEKVEHVAWRVHDQAQGEQKELIGAAVTTLSKEITGAIGRLSTDERERRLKEQVEELSRPHTMTPAPAGGGVVQR